MKRRYIYVVLCNVNPIIYGVYASKKRALDYANYLIKYREDMAKERGWGFGFYHYVIESKTKENEFDQREKTVLSVSLKIKDNLTEFSQDGTFVKVTRYPLS